MQALVFQPASRRDEKSDHFPLSSLSSFVLRPQFSTPPSLIPLLRVPLQRSVHHLGQLLNLPRRHLHTAQQHQRIHLPPSPLLHQTHLPLRIRHDHDLPLAALLLHQRRVDEPLVPPFEKAHRHGERVVQQRERDGIALRRRVVDLGQLAARDARVRDAAVPQRGEGGEAGGVDEAAVVVQDVHVRAQRPGRLAGDEAEGFGGEGARAAEGGLEGAGEVRFEVGLAVLLGPGISVVVSEDGTGRGRGGKGLTPDMAGRVSYRPDSKAGDARGESSVVMVKTPSNFRSGRGAAMEAEIRVRTLWTGVNDLAECQSNLGQEGRGIYLVLPNRTSATP